MEHLRTAAGVFLSPCASQSSRPFIMLPGKSWAPPSSGGQKAMSIVHVFLHLLHVYVVSSWDASEQPTEHRNAKKHHTSVAQEMHQSTTCPVVITTTTIIIISQSVPTPLTPHLQLKGLPGCPVKLPSAWLITQKSSAPKPARVASGSSKINKSSGNQRHDKSCRPETRSN